MKENNYKHIYVQLAGHFKDEVSFYPLSILFLFHPESLTRSRKADKRGKTHTSGEMRRGTESH